MFVYYVSLYYLCCYQLLVNKDYKKCSSCVVGLSSSVLFSVLGSNVDYCCVYFIYWRSDGCYLATVDV